LSQRDYPGASAARSAPRQGSADPPMHRARVRGRPHCVHRSPRTRSAAQLRLAGQHSRIAQYHSNGARLVRRTDHPARRPAR
jgi:hypothetical protein